jgi:glutamate/tyrosine decarboxylase-like PLP-dependent enzyme
MSCTGAKTKSWSGDTQKVQNREQGMSETRSELPERGLDKEAILKRMDEIAGEDPRYREGKTWSLVYYLGDEYTEFLKEAYGKFFSGNALNPMAFKSLKRFESDIVDMTAHMLGGGKEACGTVTSGGTESCLLAVKTYRDMACAKRPWLRKPTMIAPESIHAAFRKAAEYFDVKLVTVPLRSDYRADPEAIEKHIDRSTVMLLASAPCYPFGVIDPIEELGDIARRHRLPLHVDACLGGYLLPFAREAGYEIPPFDLRVPGVTSISADTHKYGYSAKGASTIIYRSIDYLQHQFFIGESWSGGLYASPALLGTRPGGAVAAAWAAMMHMGREGYTELAGTAMETARTLMDEVSAVPELKVIGRPDMTVFAYTSSEKGVDIYAVGDQLEAKGWHLDRTQKPAGLHTMVTAYHRNVTDQFVSDLKAAVAEVKRHPELAEQGGAAMYGLAARIPARKMVRRTVLDMMKGMYGPADEAPGFGTSRETSGTDEEGGERDDPAMKAGRLYLKLRRLLGR